MKKIFDDIAYYTIYSWISIKIFFYKILVSIDNKYKEYKNYYNEMKIKSFLEQSKNVKK